MTFLSFNFFDTLILSNLLASSDKYEFTLKYMRKYSSSLRYHESIFFNFNKVITNLEDKLGSKLMVDAEAKNIIAYIASMLCVAAMVYLALYKSFDM